MSRLDRRPLTQPIARLSAAAALVLAVLAGPAAPAAHAAGPSFGTPEAQSEFGTGLTFSQPVTGLADSDRVEVLVTYPGSIGPVIDRPVQTLDGGVQTYTIETVNGGIVPNTTVSVRWRVTPAGGSPVLGPEMSVTYDDTRFEWQTRKGPLVRLHWYRGDDAFATDALKIAEDGVEKAVDLLGVTEKDPIDFYVYADKTAFLQALGPSTREFVIGQAHSNIRTMFACLGLGCGVSDDEVARTVPHELVHLVFDTATRNPYHYAPTWLNEGLATYLSEGYSSGYRIDVETAARSNELIPLRAIAGNFPSTYEKAILAYGEGTSAVDFAIRTYGQEAFVRMVRSFAQGRTDAQAFKDAFGVDDAGFEAAWLADLGATEPQKFGPLPAPLNPNFPPGVSPAPSAAAASPGATGAATPRPSSAAVNPSPRPTGAAPVATPGNGVVTSPVVADTGSPLLVAVLIVVALALLFVAVLALMVRRRRVLASSSSTGATASGWVPPAWTQPQAPAQPNQPPVWARPQAPPTPLQPNQPPAWTQPQAPNQPWQAPGAPAQPANPWEAAPPAVTPPPAPWTQQPPVPWQQAPTVPWEEQPTVPWAAPGAGTPATPGTPAADPAGDGGRPGEPPATR